MVWVKPKPEVNQLILNGLVQFINIQSDFSVKDMELNPFRFSFWFRGSVHPKIEPKWVGKQDGSVY